MAATTPATVPAVAALEKGAEVSVWSYDLKPEGENDVTLKIIKCGVCATDIHMIDNAWGMANFPLVPGHEIIGEVVSTGSKVTDLPVGTVVGLGCVAQTCETCPKCTTEERDNLCSSVRFTYFHEVTDETGTFQHRGGFSSYIRTPASKVLKIPEGMDPAEAAPLLCAGVTTFTPLMEYSGNTGDLTGKKVGILGLGGLGHLGVQWAAKMGADTVVLSRDGKKREFAEQLGATGYLESSDKEQMDAAANTFDFILVCISGGKLDVATYANLLAPYGVLHFVGIPDEEVKFNIMVLTFSRRTISSSPVGSTKQCAQMLEFASKHGVNCIIEKFPHSKAQEAINKVRDGSIRFRAVLENDLL